MGCCIASLCFFQCAPICSICLIIWTLGQSPDPRRCQSSLHPASISLNRGISAARMLRVAASAQGKKAQEPLCLRLISPGIPCWSLKGWEDFRVEEEGRQEEGRSQVSGARPATLGMCSYWARWVLMQGRELSWCGKSLLTG